jgi:hypothetical protein
LGEFPRQHFAAQSILGGTFDNYGDARRIGENRGETGINIPSHSNPASNWSIGIYGGESPLRLRPAEGVVNPVLTCDDITDVKARFVADPFMLCVDGTWHMFFEVMPATGRVGAIGHATSPDGLTWSYNRIVLGETFHLSYPCVFEANGEYYLIPESHQAGAIRLYRAGRFPYHWSPVTTLLEGEWVEPTLFRRDGGWWLLAATPARHALRLHLFGARELTGRWREHPASPLVRDDAGAARPAGRVVVSDGALLRFAQDCSRRYGERVRAFEIIELTARHYHERVVAGVLEPETSASGWNSARMHHVDPHQLGDGRWLGCVDGDGSA